LKVVTGRTSLYKNPNSLKKKSGFQQRAVLLVAKSLRDI
jgi:hypothetical protein